ncbi:MAG: hypothetical protein ABSB49_16785, partial [Polyangia bacterium]
MRRLARWIKLRHGYRLLVWGATLTALAALLDCLPLTNLLGFDFCFVLGLVAAFAGADIAHGTVAAARRHRPELAATRIIAEAALAASAVLALPLLLSLTSGLWVRNCNLAAGFAFFALLPLCSAWYAAVTGAALAIAISRPRLGRVLVLALPLASLAWSLLRLYRDPAVFAYDPYAGYFPGPIYDEAMQPSLRLLWFRAANLTWLAAVIALVDWWCSDRQRPLRFALRPTRRLLGSPGRALVALLLVTTSWAWFASRERLGFVTTRATLANLLSRQTRSAHFVLYTDPAAESDEEALRAEEDLEFNYHQLEHLLGARPRLPITVYRFPTAAAKKEAVGAATTLFSKPWLREISVQADRFPARHLRHEMAHVFASAFGDSVFGVALAWHFWGPLPVPRLATGLIEGLAEAADFDNPDGSLTIHQEAAAMIALGKAPALASVIGTGFSLEAGARAYAIAGSFCRFLLDHFGVARLRELYRSAGAFVPVYGLSLARLESQWRAYLAGLPVDAQMLAQATEEFRRPAIFGKICARELAARVAEAQALMSTQPSQAVALLAHACRDDPGEPSYQLDLARALLADGQAQRALDTIASIEAGAPQARELRYRTASLEAAIRFRTGAWDASKAALETALADATLDAEERAARAKLRALADELGRRTLGRVLFADAGAELDPGLMVFLLTEFAREAPSEPLGPYLIARQLSSRDPSLAAQSFASACPLTPARRNGVLPAGQAEHPLAPALRRECRWQWAESAYLAGDLVTSNRA